MSEKKSVRLNKLAKEFNVSMDRILSFLENKGVEGIKPSSKIPHELHMDLLSEFQPDLKAKIAIGNSVHPRIIFLHFFFIK